MLQLHERSIYGLVLSACAASSDCNDHGTLDSCEINAGTAIDANGDGVPDECQAPVATRSIPGVGLGLPQNSPNPFNPSTTLRFHLPRAMDVEMAIVSVDGRLIDTLHAGTLPAGPYSLRWNGTDAGGRPVSSGIYYDRLIDSRARGRHPRQIPFPLEPYDRQAPGPL